MSARTLSWLCLPCAALLVAGCPAPAPAPAPEVRSPKIVAFSATPAELAGTGTVTLSWDTEDAQEVTLTDSHRGTVSGASSPDGTIQVELDRTTLFVLTARGEEGRTASAVAQVRAGAADSELVLLAQPSVIHKGGAVTLAWATTDAAGLRLSTADGQALDAGGQTLAGSITVRPEADTTYVLEAGGRRAEATVRLRAHIESFEVTPAGATPGEPLTFSWRTTGATTVTLEDAQSNEVLTRTEVEQEVASGTFALPLPASVPADRVFNFRLRAEGGTSGVVAEQSLTVYVAGQSRVLSFEVPEYARAGGTFTARWTTAEADQVVLLADGVSVFRSLDALEARAGSVVLPTPAARTRYELVATHFRGGRAMAVREVAPVTSTRVVTASATPATVAVGGEPVTLRWEIEGARRVRVSHSEDGLVFTGQGEAMASHSLTVLPNSTGTYQLVADNTLGEVVVEKLPVAVTQPARFSVSDPGTVFFGEQVTLTVPAVAGASGFVGFADPAVEVAAEAAAAQFVDIGASGSRAPFVGTADQSSIKLSVDFETWLFGEKVGGDVVVFSDGFFVFGPWAKSRTDNAPLPGPGNEPFLVAPFWDDLVFGGNSAVLWEVRGEAPDRTLIVQWNELQLKGAPQSALTFQAQVHQSGEVKFAYRTLSAPNATPTVGVQGPIPERGVAPTTAVAEGEVLTFFGQRPGAVTLNVSEPGPFHAFVKVGQAYLRLPFTFERYLPPGALAITEVMPVPHATLGDAGEWVEVSNLSGAPVDLDGWTLATGAHSVVLAAGPGQSTVVPAGGALVLATTRDVELNGGVKVDYQLPSSFTLSDAPSSVALSFGGYLTQQSWSAAQPGVSEVTDPGAFLKLGDVAGTLPHEVRCTGTRTYGTAALEQQGTPGALSGCFGYRLVRRPVDYRDISGTGQRLLQVGYSTLVNKVVPLAGTGATVFGAPLSSMTVSRHGYVMFDGPSSSSYYFDKAIAPATATPNNTAALFAQSLSLSDAKDSDVYLARVAAGEDLLNPVAHWIVQWHRVRSNVLDDLNFQLKLFDDGSLEYHYGRMESGDVNAFGRGGDAVCWLENPAGTLALPISVSSPQIRPYTAYRFIAE